MIFRELKNWIDPDKDRGLLYFAQRLDELTFPYTIDSYRAPTMGPPDLVQECIEAIRFARLQTKDAKSIWHMLDELESRLSSNPVVRELLALRLERHINYDRNSLSDIEGKLRVLSREISKRSYALKCFELAKRSCRGNKKSEIDFMAREMVTALTNYGVSYRQINQNVVSTFFQSKQVDGTSILKSFFQEIFPHHHEFKVLFKRNTPVKSLPESVLRLFRLECTETVPGEFKAKKGAARVPKLKSNECYIVASTVSATDKFSAVEVGQHTIQRIHDLFGIYHHKLDYYLDDRAFTLQKCCSDQLSEVKLEENLMRFILDNTVSDAATKVDRLTGVLRLPKGPDSAKFFRIVAFHGSASHSQNVETKIVNLWTALETISPSRENFSIISSVTTIVIPIISLGYLRRIFQVLTWDLVRWNRRILTKSLKKADLPKTSDLVEKVFCLTVLPENESTLTELLADLGNFELLRFRIYELNQILKSPRAALKFIEDHEKRVEWQLHRIYRARNKIIHSGASPSNVKSLFANAHDYFDQVFEVSCALCCGSSGYNNYQDAFYFSNSLCEQYKSKITVAKTIGSISPSEWLWTPPAEPDARHWFQ